MKRLLILSILFISLAAHAQWNSQDSLKLKQILDGKEELKLNKSAVRQIDFGGIRDTLRRSDKKGWMQPDETLPRVAYNPTVASETDSLRRDRVPRENKMPPLMLVPYRAGYAELPLPKPEKITMQSLGIVLPPAEGIRLGKKGVRVNGGTIGGLDLAQFFTKEFWQFRKKRQRESTHSVLSTY